ESPIGRGRPGWHIECSVMSMLELGESFDLHAGGEDLIFPHHENEIAQSEALTGKPFVHFWFHARFLLVEGEKMSKSAGNFFTIRDLVLKGHKPSSIRLLLASVPYRNQLNFTFDGLKQAASNVEKLRNFHLRLTTGQFSPGSNPEMQELANEAGERMKSALEDDLNTAQAQAAIFEMVRKANVAIDAGQIKQGDARSLLAALGKFDEIFAVLKDDDAPKMQSILQWAKEQGREQEGRPRRAGRARAQGRAELLPTANAKQEIPRTLAPRERGYKQLGMTSPTILYSLIRSAYQYATSRLSICNVPPVSLLSRWFPF